MKTDQRMYEFDTAISSAVPADTPIEALKPEIATKPLDEQQLERMHRYWQATNYLTIGQIYLQENPLLREPLRPEHVKPRLLGHWGTSPGLNLLYVHLNRLITMRDADVIYLAGPATAARRWWATPTWRAPTPRSTPRWARTWPGCGCCAAGSRPPGGSPATS